MMQRGIAHPDYDVPSVRHWLDRQPEGIQKLADEFPLGMRLIFPELTAIVIGYDIDPTERVAAVREEEFQEFQRGHEAEVMNFSVARLRGPSVRRMILHLPCDEHSGQA